MRLVRRHPKWPRRHRIRGPTGPAGWPRPRVSRTMPEERPTGIRWETRRRPRSPSRARRQRPRRRQQRLLPRRRWHRLRRPRRPGSEPAPKGDQRVARRMFRSPAKGVLHSGEQHGGPLEAGCGGDDGAEVPAVPAVTLPDGVRQTFSEAACGAYRGLVDLLAPAELGLFSDSVVAYTSAGAGRRPTVLASSAVLASRSASCPFD